MLHSDSLLIVGLGNPGEKYKHTRHNIGFMLLDSFVDAYNLTWSFDKKSNAFITHLKSAQQSIFCLKPQTFMNASGESVVTFCKYHTITQMLVIHDDMDLALGAMRFKQGGSSGGHNGLKSIDFLYSNDYIRMRCGIGRAPINTHKTKEQCVIEYVLGDFNQSESQILNEIRSHSTQALKFFTQNPSLNALQNMFNKK